MIALAIACALALASTGCAVIDVVTDPASRGCWSTQARADEEEHDDD